MRRQAAHAPWRPPRRRVVASSDGPLTGRLELPDLVGPGVVAVAPPVRDTLVPDRHLGCGELQGREACGRGGGGVRVCGAGASSERRRPPSRAPRAHAGLTLCEQHRSDRRICRGGRRGGERRYLRPASDSCGRNVPLAWPPPTSGGPPPPAPPPAHIWTPPPPRTDTRKDARPDCRQGCVRGDGGRGRAPGKRALTLPPPNPRTHHVPPAARARCARPAAPRHPPPAARPAVRSLATAAQPAAGAVDAEHAQWLKT